MNSKKSILAAAAILATFASSAQQVATNNREAFMHQQAYNEMQRVSGQVDVLQSNIAELSQRISRLEGDSSSRNEIEALRAEVAALKASNAELRNRINSMHDEIVKELSVKIAALMKQNAPASAPKATKSAPAAASAAEGPHREYTVRPDDSLWLIAQAFKTTVPKIKEMNNLKDNNIRPGQKLILPL